MYPTRSSASSSCRDDDGDDDLHSNWQQQSLAQTQLPPLFWSSTRALNVVWCETRARVYILVEGSKNWLPRPPTI
ncbi:hypothetical protein RRG08_037173 [Elysia crispata]|uniref:Uncharacterized protein n=1 Tax=Elysia crispata TaxID=231223 RepID=A0AAE1D9V6_9GAST|nr:hypothetical protein RRG08_037173 [Elysia crispata]